MLLDPFEEQLHLPATAVQLCDPQGWQCGVVGEKFQSFVALFVMILDAPEFFRIVVRSFHTSEAHGLIADHTGATVNRVGVKSSQGGIGFGTKHEETAKLMQSEKAGEVKVGAIHDVEGAAFRQQYIHDINIMQFAIGDMDECWDISLQIHKVWSFTAALVLQTRPTGSAISTGLWSRNPRHRRCCLNPGHRLQRDKADARCE